MAWSAEALAPAKSAARREASLLEAQDEARSKGLSPMSRDTPGAGLSAQGRGAKLLACLFESVFPASFGIDNEENTEEEARQRQPRPERVLPQRRRGKKADAASEQGGHRQSESDGFAAGYGTAFLSEKSNSTKSGASKGAVPLKEAGHRRDAVVGGAGPLGSFAHRPGHGCCRYPYVGQAA